MTLDGGTLGPIEPGETFDVPTTGPTPSRLTNAGGTQTNDVHTSCSAPLEAGETFGSMELVALDGQGLGADVTYSYLISNNRHRRRSPGSPRSTTFWGPSPARRWTSLGRGGAQR